MASVHIPALPTRTLMDRRDSLTSTGTNALPDEPHFIYLTLPPGPLRSPSGREKMRYMVLFDGSLGWGSPVWRIY